MKHFKPGPSTIGMFALATAAGLGIGGVSAAMNEPSLIVSQKGRQFHPGALSLMQGQTITIVNDDADLLHHAYVESDTFNFDSGDQEPGNRTPIVFTTKGDFKVQCGIHPKMKLVVHVE
jgi:plastocyanin